MKAEVKTVKEINIAAVLGAKRREKGITQEELAAYIGVSKASVSKWETGQSYPDVTFLPQLAAYFNISVDALLDYRPQLGKEEIKEIYLRLSADFTQKPFDDVLREWRDLVKKYYACLPLLLQLGILLINHLELVKDQDRLPVLIEEAKALFRRVKEGSDDVAVKKKALYMEAFCGLMENDAEATLALLGGDVEPALPPEVLIASAYRLTGRITEAKATLQFGIYQNLVVLFNFFAAYLPLCADDDAKFDEVLDRAVTMAKTFDMRHLHPGVLAPLYLTAAQGYLMQGNHDRSIALLGAYADTVTGDIYPLKLHGDAYFDLIDAELPNLDIGDALPRDERTIRKSMIEAVRENPAFAPLAADPHFQKIVAKLEAKLA